MKVTVEVPDRMGWVLAGYAERRGITVGEMIAGMLARTYRPNAEGVALSIRDRVRAEWERGAPDPVIAHRLQLPTGTVAANRRALGLKAHRFRREQWEHELLGKDAA